MANRYWVGGAGTWNSTSTTNWSASSGGAAGASAPTSVDDVFFNSASNATAYAVTIGLTAVAANCRDISISGPLVGNVTITSAATAVINCYGSWLNAATGVVFSGTSGAALNLLATTTGKTITTNGVTLSLLTITMNSATGGWTLGSALTHVGTMLVLAGSFSTSATGYSLASSSLSSSGTGVRSISLNSSAVALTGPTIINLSTPTNLTFNAGTSTISTINAAAVFEGGGQTFYNVTLTQAAFTSGDIRGANTFNNLTFPVKVNTGNNSIVIRANQIVTGTLTLTGTTYNTRFTIQTATIGTQFTITAGAVSLAYVDFRDIVGAGTASWAGTSLGDCLGNSGITFDAPKTVYWNLAGAQAWGAAAWALSSGGTPALANLPLAQDTAVFDDAGAAGTISAWSYNVGTVDMSLRTTTVTFNTTNTISIHGDWINGTGTVITATGIMSFFGRSLQTITPQGITFGGQITVSAFGGTVSLLEALTALGTFTLANGTLDLNGFTLTSNLFTTNTTNATAIAFGSGTISLSGTGTIFTGSITCTVTGTPQIILTDNSATARTITPAAVTEANSISFRITAGTGNLSIGTGAVRNLDFTDGTNPTGYAGAAQNMVPTIYGNFKASTGMTKVAGTGTFTFAATSGTQTITTAAVVFDNPFTFNGVGGTWQLQDALTSGATRICTLTNGTLDLNDQVLSTGFFLSSNANVRAITNFTQRMLVTGQATTIVNIGTSALLTTTGTPAVELTAAATTGIRSVTFGATFPDPEASAWSLYISAGSDQINLFATSSAYMDVDFTGFTGTCGLPNAISVYGSWTFGPGMVPNTAGASTVTFRSTSATPRTIISNGVTFAINNVTFNGIGGTWELQDAFSVGSSNTTFLNSGTLVILNGASLTTGLFNSSNTGVRTLDFSINGGLYVTGNNTAVWNTDNATNFSIAGNQPSVVFNYAGATGTRNIYHGSAGGTEANSPNCYVTAGTDAVVFNGTGRKYGTVDFTGFAGTATLASVLTIYGNLTLAAGLLIGPATGLVTFGATSGTRDITTSGITLDIPLIFNGVGGTWILQDTLTTGTQTITLTNGTLDASLAGFTTTAFSSSNSNIRGLTLGPHIYTITGTGTSWNVANITNLTFVGATSGATISMISAGANTFSGGLIDWPDLEQLGTGTLTIAGGGSFNKLYSAGYAAETGTILFTGGASYLFGSVVLLGSSGYLLTIGSTSTTPATLSKPTAWLMGVNSVDAGNNTGLTFGVSDGFIDYVSASYINGHIPTTFDADCAETATSTDILTPNGIYGVVLAAETATATDSTTRGTLWNVIDTTQIPGWTPVIT